MIEPKEVQFDEKNVRVLWGDGHSSVYANKRLRDECPCAVCQGEEGILGEKYMIPLMTDTPSDVRVVSYSRVGRYALSFVWSDGHSTGIYPYEYLLRLCECEKCTGGEERT